MTDVPYGTYYIINRTNGVFKRVVNPDFSDDWHDRYFPGGTWRNVDCFRIDELIAGAHDMAYNSELANINGLSVCLFAEPHHTPEDVERAKAWLQHTHDVVYVYVISVHPAKEDK